MNAIRFIFSDQLSLVFIMCAILLLLIYCVGFSAVLKAGVGCSDGCRCEECKNTFGTKEG